MRAVLQRVLSASVTVDGQEIGAIGPGFLVLACAMRADTPAEVARVANKITKLRVFADDDGKMNRSVVDAGGSVLLVSQFTLATDTSRGNRPGFSRAAPPEEGRILVDALGTALSNAGLRVETGKFGADMKVSLVNDGPVTIILDETNASQNIEEKKS